MKQDPNKHPYMKTLQESLDIQKKKCECLEKRLSLIDMEYTFKSEYEKNEAEIIKINTTNEIGAIKRVIKEKENYFIKFMQQYVEDIEEIESNFEMVVLKARNKAITEPKIKEFLDRIVWDNLERNTETKIAFYKQIKKMIA